MSKLDIVKIEKTKMQTPSIKTLFFDWEKDVEPGQFIMVWIPGVDEIPMSLSHIYDEQAITVKKLGEATKALHELKQGQKIGIRGPYGKGYDIKGNNILAVCGGVGTASLRTALVKADDNDIKVRCALGAETKDELLFKDELGDITHLHIATDDGSAGYDGFVTELAEQILDKDIDLILTCGPEIMMKKVFELGMENNIPVQASLERYMKCGLGLCDSCSINGYQVCRDGPVFSENELKQMDEFGNFERDKAGRKKSICK